MASEDVSAKVAARAPPSPSHVAVDVDKQVQPQEQQKRIHSLIVDTGPLIKNEPALSTLLSQAEKLYTIPSVLAEIKVSLTAHGSSFSSLGTVSDGRSLFRMPLHAPGCRRPCCLSSLYATRVLSLSGL